MSILNSDAFARVLRRCYDYPNYTVGIIFDKVDRKIDFLHEMNLHIHRKELPGAEMSSIYNIESAHIDTAIRFHNGSEIRAILKSHTQTGLSSIRGRRFHKVLLDFYPTADEEIELCSVIMPYVRDEDIDEDINIKDETTELDKFLNSFIVRQ